MVKKVFLIFSLMIPAFSFAQSIVPDWDINARLEMQLKRDRSVQYAECYFGYCDLFLRNLEVGLEKTYNITYQGALHSASTFGPISSSGDSVLTLEEDYCDGVTVGTAEYCNSTIKFAPTVEGSYFKQFSGMWTATDLTTFSFIHNIHAVAYEKCPKCDAVESGSIIKVSGQVLGEKIPVVGTSYELAYFSNYTSSYISAYPTLSKISQFNGHVWTVSV